MEKGIRIGRIAGIAIHADWSWLFIFLLVTWQLAAGVFPSWHPGWGRGLSWLVGTGASLLFFASVLAHELAHSLVARSRGLAVRRITLFLFGGISDIEREPPSPRTELVVAVVGPVTSLVLGAVFTFVGSAAARAGTAAAVASPARLLASAGPIETLLLWLGPINVFVGLFNLLPAFPLDGGRVVRALLWASSRDLKRATLHASRGGQLIGWLLIFAGLSMLFGSRLPLLGGGALNGMWLVFVGLFLAGAARASYRQLVVEGLLEGVPVRRVMRRDPPAVSPRTTLSAFVDEVVVGSDERSFPVVNEDQLVGLVSLEQVRVVPKGEWETTPVWAVMTPVGKLETVSPEDEASDALRKLTARHASEVPVVERDRLVGLVRLRDLLRWIEAHSDVRDLPVRA